MAVYVRARPQQLMLPIVARYRVSDTSGGLGLTMAARIGYICSLATKCQARPSTLASLDWIAMKELTRRQAEVLTFIEAFIDEKGFPPSVRDVTSHFNLADTIPCHDWQH